MKLVLPCENVSMTPCIFGTVTAAYACRQQRSEHHVPGVHYQGTIPGVTPLIKLRPISLTNSTKYDYQRDMGFQEYDISCISSVVPGEWSTSAMNFFPYSLRTTMQFLTRGRLMFNLIMSFRNRIQRGQFKVNRLHQCLLTFAVQVKTSSKSILYIIMKNID